MRVSTWSFIAQQIRTLRADGIEASNTDAHTQEGAKHDLHGRARLANALTWAMGAVGHIIRWSQTCQQTAIRSNKKTACLLRTTALFLLRQLLPVLTLCLLKQLVHRVLLFTRHLGPDVFDVWQDLRELKGVGALKQALSVAHRSRRPTLALGQERTRVRRHSAWHHTRHSSTNTSQHDDRKNDFARQGDVNRFCAGTSTLPPAANDGTKRDKLIRNALCVGRGSLAATNILWPTGVRCLVAGARCGGRSCTY